MTAATNNSPRTNSCTLRREWYNHEIWNGCKPKCSSYFTCIHCIYMSRRQNGWYVYRYEIDVSGAAIIFRVRKSTENFNWQPEQNRFYCIAIRDRTVHTYRLLSIHCANSLTISFLTSIALLCIVSFSVLWLFKYSKHNMNSDQTDLNCYFGLSTYLVWMSHWGDGTKNGIWRCCCCLFQNMKWWTWRTAIVFHFNMRSRLNIEHALRFDKTSIHENLNI